MAEGIIKKLTGKGYGFIKQAGGDKVNVKENRHCLWQPQLCCRTKLLAPVSKTGERGARSMGLLGRPAELSHNSVVSRGIREKG